MARDMLERYVERFSKVGSESENKEALHGNVDQLNEICLEIEQSNSTGVLYTRPNTKISTIDKALRRLMLLNDQVILRPGLAKEDFVDPRIKRIDQQVSYGWEPLMIDGNKFVDHRKFATFDARLAEYATGLCRCGVPVFHIPLFGELNHTEFDGRYGEEMFESPGKVWHEAIKGCEAAFQNISLATFQSWNPRNSAGIHAEVPEPDAIKPVLEIFAPVLDEIETATLSDYKASLADSLVFFRKGLAEAIRGLEQSGDPMSPEIQEHMRRDYIQAPLIELEIKNRQIARSALVSGGAQSVALATLSVFAVSGATSPNALIGLLASLGVFGAMTGVVQVAAGVMQSRGDLSTNSMYFIWRIAKDRRIAIEDLHS